jgi:hypothetical protein
MELISAKEIVPNTGQKEKGNMSSPATIQTQFASYDTATVEQTVIKAVLAVYINAEPQYPDNECISGLREDLPPSLLYSGKAGSGATILHRLPLN